MARLGLAGGAVLLPTAAQAADGGTVAALFPVWGALLLGAIAAAAWLALRGRRQSQRLRNLDLTATLALAECEAMLANVPAALCRWEADGAERFTAGAVAALNDIGRGGYADMIARVEAK